ncbi:MAG: hypothetical protein IPH20_26140 [Bacteroidales bacterium]|nr:hypothetical protein [Bacteroidales bacterium]
MSFPKALVRRNGIVEEIDSGHVVPGDVIILDAGRFIAADLRLIESTNLQIDSLPLLVSRSHRIRCLPHSRRSQNATWRPRKHCIYVNPGYQGTWQ